MVDTDMVVIMNHFVLYVLKFSIHQDQVLFCFSYNELFIIYSFWLLTNN